MHCFEEKPMRRHLLPLVVLGFSALVAASGCGELLQPREAAREIDPLDTIQTRGALLASGEWARGQLAWVPGTELIAFNSNPAAGVGKAIKTVDAGSGEVGVVDSDYLWTALGSLLPHRALVAAPDGSALYYLVGMGAVGSYESVLRAADPIAGGMRTLRSGVEPTLAVSPDGERLAYLAGRDPQNYTDSLIVRDLSNGAETNYGRYDRYESGGPIVFSPDGTELLYEVRNSATLSRILYRLSLDGGTDELVSLPDRARARLIRWGASGIEVLAEISQEYPSEYHVLNLTTGGSVQVGSITRGEGEPYENWVSRYAAWSMDGTRVAYWTIRCIEWAQMFDCSLTRCALFVADTRTGTRVRVAYTSDRTGPTAFSPDGTRIVYHGAPENSSGNFYVVEVP